MYQIFFGHPTLAYTLTADQASFVLSGQSANLNVSLILVANTASYTLSGQSVVLDVGYRLVTVQASYLLTFYDANFIFTPVASIAIAVLIETYVYTSVMIETPAYTAEMSELA